MKINNLYTVILDFDDGTYISQVRAETLEEVIRKWLKKQKEFEIEEISDFTNIELFAAETSFSLIQGLSNVWCVSLLVGEELALLHIVLTQSK